MDISHLLTTMDTAENTPVSAQVPNAAPQSAQNPGVDSASAASPPSTVSKMRSHRGNAPVLPQNKPCPFCPAKFTRSAHLNRHLLTHSNQRQYRCDNCDAQFTRSDLLSRHKRSCDPSNPVAPRRRSCVACAQSKTKCDSGQPCEKCALRGRECVYRDPKVRKSTTRSAVAEASSSRNAAAAANAGQTSSMTAYRDNYNAWDSRPSGQLSDSSLAFDDIRSETTAPPTESWATLSASDAGSAFQHPAASSYLNSLYSPGLFQPFLNTVFSETDNDPLLRAQRQTDSIAADIYSFPLLPMVPESQTELLEDVSVRDDPMFDTMTDPAHYVPFPGTFNPSSTASSSSSSSSSAMPAPGIRTPASPNQSVPRYEEFRFAPTTMVAPTTTPSASTETTSPAPSSILHSSPEQEMQQSPAMAETPSSMTVTMSPVVEAENSLAAKLRNIERESLAKLDTLPSMQQQHQQQAEADCSSDMPESSRVPSKTEFHHFFFLFFTTFSPQYPLLHTPTFNVANKPIVLLQAMKACGALLVNTQSASEFILWKLEQARDELLHEFAREMRDFSDQTHIVLAVVLLQTIGLFHQRADQRTTSSMYHAMLVVMIRRIGLIARCAAYEPPEVINESNADSAWRAWVFNEVTKRAILMSLFHDASQAIYFGLKPTYHRDEVDIRLPCEDILWKAVTAEDWLNLLHQKSPYGSIRDRLMGVRMLPVMADMRSPTVKTNPTPITAFGHFVLIHAILSDVSTACLKPVPANQRSNSSSDPELMGAQLTLHNWLHSWLNSPDSSSDSQPNSESAAPRDPPFLENALPFYWLGQVALLAHAEGYAPFAPGDNVPAEMRFRLIKGWLRHIKVFLKQGAKNPTLFWDEMMKIRLTSALDGEDEAEAEEKKGLVGFFSNAA